MHSKKLREYEEEDFLMISALQHFSFCRRQWALIHIEQQWEENYFTVDGDFFHQKAHDEKAKERRNGVVITRGMKVFSRRMGLSGNCDVVEFHPVEDGITLQRGITLQGEKGFYQPVLIEYKRGKPKEHSADEIQLCAQAMCLEEMLLCSIEYGYLYYGETRRRTTIDFTDQLRRQVEDMAEEMHGYYERAYTPKVKRHKGCSACSLVNICLPKLDKAQSVSKYLSEYLKEGE